jgi:hypothetical protein
MAGLDPAIHVLVCCNFKGVNARHESVSGPAKPDPRAGHDEGCLPIPLLRSVMDARGEMSGHTRL